MLSDARHPSPFWPSVVILIAASVVYCAPLFTNLDWYGWQDWDQFTFRYETSRVALLRDLQWPVWNPYANGGTALLAHPHSPVLSPWYLVALVLGAPIGLRVQVLLFMALGSIGMAALMRQCGAGRVAGITAGIVMMMSAHYALHITEGHLEWTALGAMPWVVLGLWRAQARSLTGDGRRPLMWAALWFASAITLGAVYITAVYVLFLTTWMAFESIRRRSARPLVAWAVVAALAGGVAAAKLIPMTQFTSAYPRSEEASQRTTLKAVVLGVTATDQAARYLEYRGTKDADTDFSAMPMDWWAFDVEFHEYGAYPGVVGALVILIGVVTSARIWWPLYAAGGVLVWMMLGTTATPDLWALVRRLPMYDQLHVPSRMLAALVSVAAIAAGFGMDALQRWLGASTRIWQGWPRVLPWALCALLYCELAVMGHALLTQVFRVPPVPLTPYSDFAQRPAPPESAVLVPGTMKSLLYPRLLANWGAVDGYENLSVPTGRVLTTADAGYRGEVYVTGAQGHVALESWTMARVRGRVRADGPGAVVMNQNYDPGWSVRMQHLDGTVTDTPAVRTPDGLIATNVDSGDVVVEFRYWPNGLTVGLWVSVLSLGFCVGGFRRW
jgi:hypothetical protein